MIKKSISKILIILIFFGLNWAGISAIGETFAYFSDTENSNSNTYQTGTLDFSLRSGQTNFVPPEIANNMSPGESVTRDIYIKKDGSLPFQYDSHSEPTPSTSSCDLEFYDLLELKVWYNWYDDIGKHMDLKYDGFLKDFDFAIDTDLQIPNSHPYYYNVFYGPNEHWFYFRVTYPSEASKLTGQQCEFKFIFEGWQTNLVNSSSGFSDTEEIHSTLIDGIFEEEFVIDNSNIVINEFLPISGDYPEFIEFYNKGDVQLDIADWIIQNKNTSIVINSDILYGDAVSTIIEFGKWLVIDLSKVGEDILDNTSDIITLYDNDNNLIDTIFYTDASMVDKSHARIPDGSPSWVDPIPTPGSPNKLDEEEVEELQLEEIIEEIPLIIATTTTSTISDSDILENSTTTTTTIPDETTNITTEPLVARAATTCCCWTPIKPVTSGGGSVSTTTTTEPPVEETTTTTTTIPEELIIAMTTVSEIPITTTTTTIPDLLVVIEPTTTTTTIEPPVEELPTTTTTTLPAEEDVTTTTTTIIQPPTTTTTIEPQEEEIIPITTTTTIPPTTTTTESPAPTTTTTQPPEPIDSEPDDSIAINLN